MNTVQNKQLVKKLLITYCSAIVIALGTLTISGLIPLKLINYNASLSAETLLEEGLYYDILHLNRFNLSLDNFTDALMIDEAIAVDWKQPVNSMMLNNYVKSDTIDVHEKNPVEDLYYNVYHPIDNERLHPYSRYWHGYLVFLRPMLIFTDYVGIRIFNIFLFSLLSITLVILLYKKRNMEMAMSFALTLICSMWVVIPFSMQFMNVFYVALLSMLVMLIFPKLTETTSSAITFFFAVGMITSFIDLLTAPMVALGFPLLCYLPNTHGDKVKRLFAMSIAWSIGYAGFWASKWLVGTILTGENIFVKAFEEVGTRLNVEATHWDLLVRLYDNLITLPMLVAIAILVLAYIILLKKSSIKASLYLLLVALIPLAWLLLLNNHTYIHYWFSWRNLSVAIFALILFFMNTTKVRDLLGRFF